MEQEIFEKNQKQIHDLFELIDTFEEGYDQTEINNIEINLSTNSLLTEQEQEQEQEPPSQPILNSYRPKSSSQPETQEQCDNISNSST